MSMRKPSLRVTIGENKIVEKRVKGIANLLGVDMHVGHLRI